MKCAACGGRVRQTRRALVLVAGGRVKPGRVCHACTKGGWLLVFGEDVVTAPRPQRVPSVLREAFEGVEPSGPGRAARAELVPFEVKEGDVYRALAFPDVPFPCALSLLPPRAGSVRAEAGVIVVEVAHGFVGKAYVVVSPMADTKEGEA